MNDDLSATQQAYGPAHRLLRLLALLQDGSAWTADDLQRATDVPGRTLRRDITALKELGYKVASTRGRGGHYRMTGNPTTPPIPLQGDEAVAAVVSLHAAAHGAVGIDFPDRAASRAEHRLLESLPPADRHQAQRSIAALGFTGDREEPVDSSTLSLFSTAVSEHREISFTHNGRSGPARRTVEPARLVSINHRWYLHGWDRDRHDWRTFRLDRTADVQVTSNKFVPAPLPVGEIREVIRGSFRGTPANLTVILELDTDPLSAASSLYRVDGALEPCDGGRRTRYTALVDSHEWLLTVLVLSDLEFTVVDPPEFRDVVARTVARFGRAIHS